MKTIFTLVLCLTLWAGAAHAQTDGFNDKLCKELSAELGQFLSRNEYTPDHLFDDDSPMMIIIDAAMVELDEAAILRIRVPLAKHFDAGCIRPPSDYALSILKEHGLPENPTVGQFMDAYLEHFKLDRSAPRWGLIDLPEMEVSKLTMEELFGVFENLPRRYKYENPFNDVFIITMRKYWSVYDLSTPEAHEKAGIVMISLSFGWGSPTETAKNTLDRLAAEQGLQLK